MWNGYASIQTNENFVCFNFRSLMINKNDTIANAQMLLVFKFLDNEIAKNRDFNLKYFADAENIKVRLVASAEKLAEQVEGVATTHLGIFLYDVVDGSGDGYWGWWNSAAGNNEYEGEHVGVITGTDLSLSVNDVNVEVEKVVEGDDVARS